MRKLFGRRYLRIPAPILESPWELFIAYLCAASGLPLLLHGPEKSAGSINSVLPAFLVYVWGSCLFLGGILIIIGRFQRKTSYFRIERSGLVLLGTGSAIYGCAIIIASWPSLSGGVASIFILSFAGTCAVQYYKLGRAIAAITQAHRFIKNGGENG